MFITSSSLLLSLLLLLLLLLLLNCAFRLNKKKTRDVATQFNDHLQTRLYKKTKQKTNVCKIHMNNTRVQTHILYRFKIFGLLEMENGKYGTIVLCFGTILCLFPFSSSFIQFQFKSSSVLVDL